MGWQMSADSGNNVPVVAGEQICSCKYTNLNQWVPYLQFLSREIISKFIFHALTTRLTLFVKLRIMISMNLESSQDSESVNALFTIPWLRNYYKFIFHALTTQPTLFVKLWTQYVAENQISTNIEFSWDLNESILSWEFLGQEINYTFIFDALIWENTADTICSIVDAICGWESWSQQI